MVSFRQFSRTCGPRGPAPHGIEGLARLDGLVGGDGCNGFGGMGGFGGLRAQVVRKMARVCLAGSKDMLSGWGGLGG